MSDIIIMPRELTAENGAKALLSGEFKEEITQVCDKCDGDGVYYDDPLGEDGDVETDCPRCQGSGEVLVPVTVSWTTIKAIYKMAAERLGKDL